LRRKQQVYGDGQSKMYALSLDREKMSYDLTPNYVPTLIRELSTHRELKTRKTRDAGAVEKAEIASSLRSSQ